MRSIKNLLALFSESEIVRDNIRSIAIVPIVFTIYACLEVYVLKQLSNLITPNIGIENLALFIAIYIFYTSTYLLQQYLTYHFPVYLALELSEKLFDELLLGNIVSREGNAGHVYSLLIDEIKRFTHLVMTPLMMGLQRISTLVVYIGAGIYLYGVKVLLLGIVAIPLFIVLEFQKKYRVSIDREIAQTQSIRSELVQTVQSDNAHIKSYYPASFIAIKFNKFTNDYFKTYANASILVDSQRILLDIVILFSCIFISLLKGDSDGDISSKVMFILILFRAGPQVLALLNSATQISTNISSADGILKYFSSKNKTKAKVADFNHLGWIDVRLKNGRVIKFSRGINLVVGPSGSGKSTLLEDLMRNKRMIVAEIDSQYMPNYSPSYISSKPKIFAGGFKINRFDDSVDELIFKKNIKYLFDEDLSESDIEVLMDKADVPSLGQLQRIAIARVLASKSNIIAIDETLSGLDAVTLNRLMQLLESSGLIVIIATHDERLLGKYQIAYQFN